MSEENEEEKFTIDGISEDDMSLSDRIEHVFKTELFEEELGDFSSDIEQLKDRADSSQKRVEDIDDRVYKLESKHESDIEDIRQRVLQVARMINDSEDQQREETLNQLEDIESKLSEVQDDISENSETIDSLGCEVDSIKEKTKEFEKKLNKLAKCHLDLKQKVERRLYTMSDSEERMRRLRDMAQRKEIIRARCEDCKGTVLIPYLNECECSNCGSNISEIRNRFFRSPLILTEDE